MAKKSKGFIQKKRCWDFTKDGMYSENRIKDFDKQYLKKQRRYHDKREAKKQYGEEEKESLSYSA